MANINNSEKKKRCIFSLIVKKLQSSNSGFGIDARTRCAGIDESTHSWGWRDALIVNEMET